jgi:hypothetical protein
MVAGSKAIAGIKQWTGFTVHGLIGSQKSWAEAVSVVQVNLVFARVPARCEEDGFWEHKKFLINLEPDLGGKVKEVHRHWIDEQGCLFPFRCPLQGS